jgi:PKD repeat protein
VRKRRIAASAALVLSMTALSQTPAFAAASVPGTPTNLGTTPTPMTAAGTAQACGTGTAFASYQNIDGGQYVSLSAKINAGGDNAAGYSDAFYVTDETSKTVFAPLDSIGQSQDGATVSVDLPIVNGDQYTWTVAETDGTSWSPSAGPCDFIADTSAPTNPVVTSTDFPTAGGGLESGEPGSFTLTSTDPAPATGTGAGLRGFSYVFDGTLGVGGPVVAANADDSLTISGQSFSWGTHTLSVQAVDTAGNVSGITQYSFYVAQNPELNANLSLSRTGPTSVSASGGSSNGLWPIVKCTYDFGDGSTPVSNTTCAAVTHEYAAEGTYPVTLTVTDQYGNQQSKTQSFDTMVSRGELFEETLASEPVSPWASPTGSTGINQAADTGLPDGSSQLVAVTAAGTLEHNIHYANGTWQGWRALNQPGVTVVGADIAGLPNGSSQVIEVTKAGTLLHNVRNANGSWQKTGWGSPAGSTGIVQAAITGLPNGSSQLVAVTDKGTLEHNIRNANGSWQGWRALSQPGVTVTDAGIAGLPNGSSQVIEVTSTGTLLHNVRNANGSWQKTGWGSPAGSTGIVQASIAALPNGSTHLVAVTTLGIVENNLRSASGAWASGGWGQLGQTVKVLEAANVSIAGLPNGTAQVIEVSAI